MSNRSMVDIAYELMTKKKKGVAFNKLWEEVSQMLGYNPTLAQKKIAQFYTTMMLDKRFVNLGNNLWDLTSRHTYDETHFDTASIEIEDTENEEEEELIEDEEDLEEDEYKIYDESDEDNY